MEYPAKTNPLQCHSHKDNCATKRKILENCKSSPGPWVQKLPIEHKDDLPLQESEPTVQADHTSHGAAGELAAAAQRKHILPALLWAIKASL
jgi:hypothetical protein